MVPVLMPSSKAVVKMCGIAAIRPGDIAVFKSDGSFICHRVVAKFQKEGRPFIATRADISYAGDPPAGEADVVGRVVAVCYGSFCIGVDSRPARAIGIVVSRAAALSAYVYFKAKRIFLRWIRP